MLQPPDSDQQAVTSSATEDVKYPLRHFLPTKM